MRDGLAPQTSRARFYPLFTDAPATIGRAAEPLAELVAAAPPDRVAFADGITEAEHRGDELTHQILVLLDSTFVTPFDREDIYRLASSLDDVLDAIEDAGDRIVLYRLGTLPAALTGQCDVLCRANRLTRAAMAQLADVAQLHDYTVEINSLEEQADTFWRRAQQVHTAYWAETMAGRLTGPQYAVLHVVGRWPRINQRRLGELAALDSSTTTDIVTRLAGRGWLTREKDPDDGRGRVLTLTEQAAGWLDDIHPKVELVQRRLLTPLSPRQRTPFMHDLAWLAFEGSPPEAVK